MAELWAITLEIEIWSHIAIILKLGQMLQGQMLPGLMSPRQLPTNTDDLISQPSKFGRVLTSNIRERAAA